jgi:hypothetical protein
MDDIVCFRISDAYLPEPAEVLAALTPETEVLGVLLALSDEGVNQDVFATVEIDGKHHVIVPVSKLRHVPVEKTSRESRRSDISA